LNSSPFLTFFLHSKNLNMESSANTLVGTAYYMAPEVFSASRPGGRTYDGRAVDIWACGVMLLVLLRGAYPFTVRDDSEALKRGSELAEAGHLQQLLASLVDDSLPHASPACKALLHSTIRVEPAARPTAAALLAEPWLEACAAEMPNTSTWVPAPPPAQSLEEMQRIVDGLAYL